MKDLQDCALVACGTLQPELRALAGRGLLDAGRLFFTAPGLHETPRELDKQLGARLRKAGAYADKVIVAYGGRCYVDTADPVRDIESLIAEHGKSARRVQADNCVDMLAGRDQREEIAGGRRIYWLTPGWLRYWRHIFRDWDAGQANETFPQHDAAVLLDGIGFFETYSQEKPDEVLAFSDWMKIPIEPHAVSLDRLRDLLTEQASRPWSS